jgi:hypothetical protein
MKQQRSQWVQDREARARAARLEKIEQLWQAKGYTSAGSSAQAATGNNPTAGNNPTTGNNPTANPTAGNNSSVNAAQGHSRNYDPVRDAANNNNN